MKNTPKTESGEWETKFQQMWSKTVNRLIMTWKFKGANTEAQKHIKVFLKSETDKARQELITKIKKALPRRERNPYSQYSVETVLNILDKLLNL